MLNFSTYIVLVVVHAAVWCMCAVMLHYSNRCGCICALMVCNLTWELFVYMEKELLPETNEYINMHALSIEKISLNSNKLQAILT